MLVRTLTGLTSHSAKSLNVYSHRHAPNTWSHQFWRSKLNSQNPNQPNEPRLTSDQIEVRIWGFVVVMITVILFGIVFALLYSVTFVTQPIKTMAPIDMAYTKMLNDIVLLIVGGIGGIVGKRAVGAAAMAMASPAPVTTTTTTTVQPAPAPAQQGFNWLNFQNAALDESWTPPPPPTTPADHLEADEEREHLSLARKEAE